MKVKTSELTGAALDWAVAEASGVPIYRSGKTLTRMDMDGNHYWQPSTDWALAGPIIEREGIGIERDDQGIWFASYDLSEDCAVGATGSTPLIAAMRLYVTKELDTLALDVPDNLVKG